MLKVSFLSNSLKAKTVIQALLHYPRASSMGDRLLSNSLSRFLSVESTRVFLFNSGRMALYSFLKSLGLKAGDEIIVPGYTCVVVTNAIKYLEATAVYADIDEGDLNINLDKILKAVSPKTKAIVISHNFGIPFKHIDEIKTKYPDIVIIEDAAHVMGSNFKGRSVGTLGDAAFFSFEYSKPITTGMGGALLINNPRYMTPGFIEYFNSLIYPGNSQKIRIIIGLLIYSINGGRIASLAKRILTGVARRSGLLVMTSSHELTGSFPPNYPSRLDPLLGYIGYCQMRSIHEITKHKRMLAEAYREIFAGLPNIRQFYGAETVYVRYPVVYKGGKDRNYLIARMVKETGIDVGEWFNDVVHPRGSCRYCYSDGQCPVGEGISRTILNFPVSLHLPVEYLRQKREKIREIMYE